MLIVSVEPTTVKKRLQKGSAVVWAEGIWRKFDKVIEAILVIAMLAELVIMFGNVLERLFLGSSIVWSEEAGQFVLAVIGFIGGALAYYRGKHMAMRAVVDRLPVHRKRVVECFGDWVILVFGLVGIVLSIKVVYGHRHDYAVTLPVSQSVLMLPLVIGIIVLAVYAIRKLVNYTRRELLMSGVGLLVLSAILWGLYMAVDWTQGSGVLYLMFGVFILLFVAAVPIGFVLPASAMFYLYYADKAPLQTIPQSMFSGISSFVLLAIPFFVWAGYIMTDGGLSTRLANFVVALVGRIRGGFLQVIVVCMYIVSGLSGSKVADVVAVGTTMNSMLKENGYEPGETASVLSASAAMGETIPPSIAMMLLGSITTLSIGTLFVAGILPAAVIAVCLMILIYFRARNFNLKPVAKTSGKETFRLFLIALPALAVPIILIGGIVSGIATPTEGSSTAVIYSLVLGGLFYRQLTLRTSWRNIVDSAITAGMVLFIVSTASSFSWILTVAQLPVKLSELLSGLQGMPWLFMLGSIVILIITGALLEGLPALLIFAPLFLPFAEKFGINPLQYGLVLIIAMGIGTFSPPIGVGMYVACSVSESTMEEASHRMIPYIVVLIIGLLFVAFVPWFSLILPRLISGVQV